MTRLCPSASYIPSHNEEYKEEKKGEYFEEEMQVDVNHPWSEPPRDSVTLYAYGGEDNGSSEYTILDTLSLYDRVDVESQDNGFGYTSVTETDIKEHCIDQAKDFLTTLGLTSPTRPKQQGRHQSLPAGTPDCAKFLG